LGKPEKKKGLRYAGFAILGNPVQHVAPNS
jgi:hypothetical protein